MIALTGKSLFCIISNEQVLRANIPSYYALLVNFIVY